MPIRARVTAAFAVAMAAVLALTGLLIYQQFAASADETIDATLFEQAESILADLDEFPEDFGPPLEPDAPPRPDPLASGSLSALIDDEGDVIVASDLALAALDLPLSDAGTPVDVVLPAEGGEPEQAARVLLLPVPEPGPADPGFIAVGTPLDARAASLDRLQTLLIVGLGAALVLSCAAAYVVASASLRPVEAMRRRAGEISGRVGGERLPVQGDDEIARLGETMNDLLARVEDASRRERAFLADASHELRTPLTTLRAELELADRPDADEAELRTSVAAARREAARLSRLSEELLTLARGDAGELAPRLEPVRVAAVADVATERLRRTATEQGRTIAVEVPDDLTAHADAQRLDAALTALVDNALRHGAGEIAVEGGRDGDEVVVTVVDEGPGFPEDFLPQAFERFSRADAARAGEGAGLGLAIVAAVAEACGGHAEAANREGAGAEVRLTLPAVAPA